MSTGAFRNSPTASHRLRHRNDLPIDLLPFGTIETTARTIAWPPKGEMVMDVFGFKEALASSLNVILPENVRTRVVSLPALALLKLICWDDRHYRAPRKDAHDLNLILRNYLSAGNAERLFEKFPEWTEEKNFDYQLAGPRMLGHDIRLLLDEEGLQRIGSLLSEQCDTNKPAHLPSEMNANDPERPRAMLEAMFGGLMES